MYYDYVVGTNIWQFCCFFSIKTLAIQRKAQEEEIGIISLSLPAMFVRVGISRTLFLNSLSDTMYLFLIPVLRTLGIQNKTVFKLWLACLVEEPNSSFLTNFPQ